MSIMITKENIVLPWKMWLNVSESTIPYSTGVEETTEIIPGVDGEIQTSNRYSSGEHSLVLRSWPDITTDEKNALYDEVNRFLVVARQTDQKLHYERTGRVYSVRAVGTPERPQEYATWIEFRLPLKAHDPIGYSRNERTVSAKGMIDNRGNVPAYATIEFDGPVTNPAIMVNGESFSYIGTIPTGKKLVISSKDYTVLLIDKKTAIASNANHGWNGKFLILHTGYSELQGITNAVGYTKVVWKDGWA